MPSRPGNALTEFRFHHDFFEPGAITFNAKHTAKHPLTTGTQGVVVEGVHLHVAKTPGLAVAVPTLPDGGSTLVDGIAPAGVGRVLDDAVGKVTTPHVGEGRQQDGNPQKSGGKVIVIFFDSGNKMLFSLLSLGIGKQVERERHAVGCLQVTLDFAIRFDKGLLEVGTDILKVVIILGGIIQLAQSRRHLRHQAGGISVVSGRD